MNDFTLSQEAEFDLLEIWDYIELKTKNADVADKFIMYIYSLLDCLATTPGMGRKRDDLRSGLRSYPFPQHTYIVYYSTRENDIYVNRILQGNRDQLKQFG